MSAFYSDRLHFHAVSAEDQRVLEAALAASALPRSGPELRELAHALAEPDDSVWALKRVRETVGACIARRDGSTHVVGLLLVPRWEGVHYAGEVIGRLAERAFEQSASLRLPFGRKNLRALRVAQRLGCTIEEDGDVLVATLTPTTWMKLERKPSWSERRLVRMMESGLPPAWLERVVKQLEAHVARDREALAPPPPPPRRTSGDPVCDELLATPPTRRATAAEVLEAGSLCPYGGDLGAIQALFRKAYFSDDELGQLCLHLRSGVTAGLELRSAEEAIAWIRSYVHFRAPFAG